MRARYLLTLEARAERGESIGELVTAFTQLAEASQKSVAVHEGSTLHTDVTRQLLARDPLAVLRLQDTPDGPLRTPANRAEAHQALEPIVRSFEEAIYGTGDRLKAQQAIVDRIRAEDSEQLQCLGAFINLLHVERCPKYRRHPGHRHRETASTGDPAGDCSSQHGRFHENVGFSSLGVEAYQHTAYFKWATRDTTEHPLRQFEG